MTTKEPNTSLYSKGMEEASRLLAGRFKFENQPPSQMMSVWNDFEEVPADADDPEFCRGVAAGIEQHMPPGFKVNVDPDSPAQHFTVRWHRSLWGRFTNWLGSSSAQDLAGRH